MNKSTRGGSRGRKRKITIPQAPKPKLTLVQPQVSDVEEVEIGVDPADLSEAIDLNDGVDYIDGVPFADAADIASNLDCSSSNESSGELEEPAGASNGQPKKRKKQFRWNSKKDLALVLDVQNYEPFLERGSAKTECWNTVASVFNRQFVGANISGKRANQHFTLLLNAFKKEDFLNRYKSGTEEEFEGIKVKLSLLKDLIADHESALTEEQNQKKVKATNEKSVGEDIRLAALSTVKKRKTDEDGVEASGPTRRYVQKTLLEAYEESKSEDRKSNEKIQDAALKDKKEDRDLEKLRIELEHEKLAVEKQRLEMLKEKQDKEMDLARECFDLEKEERMNQLKTNQTLLNLLIAKKA